MTGPWSDDDAADGIAPRARIRPFVLTSGRVADESLRIGLETQVTTKSMAPAGVLTPELATIVSLCAEPLSVAEISARVPLQYGVARVLVSDLYASGHVDVHTMDEAMSQDPELIMRVIRGLRELS